MNEKYLLFSLEDEQSKKLGEIISNPTCKKIVSFLAEKEASETDIAKELKIPLNTAEYNIKKLLEAGIIEKAKDYLWSAKGKKINAYKVANKLIVISPKKTSIYSKLKEFAPLVAISCIFTAFIVYYFRMLGSASTQVAEKAEEFLAAGAPQETATQILREAPQALPASFLAPIPAWGWFLMAIWLILLGYIIYSLKKR